MNSKSLDYVLKNYSKSGIELQQYIIKDKINANLVKSAKGAYWPKLSANARLTFGKVKGDIVLEQNIFSGGRIGAEVDIAKQNKAIAAHQSNYDIIQGKLHIIKTYMNYLSIHNTLKIYTKRFNYLYKKIYNKYQKSYRHQASSEADALLVKIEYVNFKNNYSSLISRANQARQELENIYKSLNINFNSNEIVSPNFYKKIDNSDLNTIEKGILNQNAFIQSFNSRLSLNNAYTKLARSKDYPQISLIGGYRYEYDDSVEDDNEFFAGVKISMNLFEGYSNQYKKRALLEEKKLDKLLYKSKKQSLKTEADNLVNEYLMSKEKFRQVNQNLSLIQESWSIIRSSLDSGISLPATTVVTTFNKLISLSTSQIKESSKLNELTLVINELKTNQK